MSRKTTTRIAALALAGSTIAIGLMAAAPANAAEGDGNCSTVTRDLCLYFNSGYGGSRFNDPTTDNYVNSGYTFVSYGNGNGAGQYVWDNAASAQNYDLWDNGYVFYNSNHQGPSDLIPGGGSTGVQGLSQLQNTYNQNASQAWDCGGYIC